MRKIALSEAFLRKLARFLKIHKDMDKEKVFDRLFEMMREDAFSPLLHTHKLHGKMSDQYACRVTYRYRLVFSIDNNIIFPQSVGSHDDVY